MRIWKNNDHLFFSTENHYLNLILWRHAIHPLNLSKAMNHAHLAYLSWMRLQNVCLQHSDCGLYFDYTDKPNYLSLCGHIIEFVLLKESSHQSNEVAYNTGDERCFVSISYWLIHCCHLKLDIWEQRLMWERMLFYSRIGCSTVLNNLFLNRNYNGLHYCVMSESPGINCSILPST